MPYWTAMVTAEYGFEGIKYFDLLLFDFFLGLIHLKLMRSFAESTKPFFDFLPAPNSGRDKRFIFIATLSARDLLLRSSSWVLKNLKSRKTWGWYPKVSSMLKIFDVSSSMSKVAVDLYLGLARKEKTPVKKKREPAKVTITHFLLTITLQYSIKSNSFLLSALFMLIPLFSLFKLSLREARRRSNLTIIYFLPLAVYYSLKFICNISTDQPSIPIRPVIIRLPLPEIDHQSYSGISY